MRQGQNPAKMGLKAYQPKPLGVVLLSYIPSQDGYFTHSLDILRYQIASLHATTPDFDLLIFDNGSCPEVQEEMTRWYKNGQITYLFLSIKNYGKAGTLNWCLGSMPNEWLCYSDGDTLFRQGWWERSREIMDSFPEAGLVAAQPCLYDVLKGNGRAVAALPRDAGHLVERVLPQPGVVEEYGRGIGLNVEQIAGIKKRNVALLQNQHRGVSAVIGASHMQFLIRRETAARVLPLQAEYALSTKEDTTFNTKIDQLGYLQLSTREAFVVHIGNRINEEIRQEIRERHLESVFTAILDQPRTIPASGGLVKMHVLGAMKKISTIRAFDLLFRRIYNFLFEYFAQ